MAGQHHNPNPWLTAANEVHLSALALKRGREFLQAVQTAKPDGNWLLAYSWADSRRIRTKGTNIWNDLGAGFDNAVHDRADVPPANIGQQGGVDYVVVAPPAVLAASKATVIDIAQDGRTLILR